ncbi:hypothetical protein Tco_1310474 [Tanacetum coccineum]
MMQLDLVYGKKDNLGNKRREENQSRNWGGGNPDKRQRVARNYGMAAQGLNQATNDRPVLTCYECGSRDHLWNMERITKIAKSKLKSQSSQKVNRKVNWSKSKSTQVNPEAKKSTSQEV